MLVKWGDNIEMLVKIVKMVGKSQIYHHHGSISCFLGSLSPHLYASINASTFRNGVDSPPIVRFSPHKMLVFLPPEKTHSPPKW